VQEVRSRIEGYEAQGGIEAAVTEKSTAQKVFEVAVGKAVISDFRKPEGEAVATTATSSSTSALGIAAAARVVLAVVVSEFPYKVCKFLYLPVMTYLVSILYACCYAVLIIIIVGYDIYIT